MASSSAKTAVRRAVLRPRAVGLPEAAQQVGQIVGLVERLLESGGIGAIEDVGERRHVRRGPCAAAAQARVAPAWLADAGDGAGSATAAAALRSCRDHHPATAANRQVRLRHLHGDFVRAAVAILFCRLDAEQVVRGELGLNPRQRRVGVAELHGEQRAAGRTGELLQPPRQYRPVAELVVDRAVGVSRLGAEAIVQGRVDVERVDGGVGGRGFLADLNAEAAEIRPAARAVAGNHAAAHQEERLAPGVALHLRHERAQHAEARRRLAFVVERRVGDLGHELIAAVRIGVDAAFTARRSRRACCRRPRRDRGWRR